MSSTYIIIERLLQVKSALATVLQQLEWDNLPTSDWKQLENVYKLLKAFAIYTSLISGKRVCYTLICYPCGDGVVSTFRRGNHVIHFVVN